MHPAIQVVGYVVASSVAVLGVVAPDVLPVVGGVVTALCGLVISMKPLASALRVAAAAVGTDQDWGDKAALTFERVVDFVADLLVTLAQPWRKKQ
jgi:hypothetical protein